MSSSSWAVIDINSAADSIQYLSDLDSNKYVDVLVQKDNSLFAIYQLVSGNIVSFQSTDLKIPMNGITRVYVTSLNADEYPDIVTISSTAIQLFKGAANSAYNSFKSITTTSDKVIVRDINFDGVSDIFIINSNTLDMYISDPNDINKDYNHISYNGNVKSIVFFDADGDCITDLLILTNDNKYNIYAINHDKTATAKQFSDIFTSFYTSTFKSICEVIGVADFDRN